MKYNNLSLLGVLLFASFIFLSPINVSAQEITSQSQIQQITMSTKEKANSLRIEDLTNKYIEVTLVNGKKVKGKLIEYKNDNLVLKDGLIKKQISMANVVSFETVKSPEEKFKDTMQTIGNVATVVLYVAPAEIFLHAFNIGCLVD